MKTIVTALILFLPCFLVLNESEYFVPNIIGLIYIYALYVASKTRLGKLFLRKLERITNKYIDL